MQSLMESIQGEVAAWNVTIDASCDAAALEALKQKKERIATLQQERDEIAELELNSQLADLERRRLLDKYK